MLRLKNGGSLRKAGEKNSSRDFVFKRADGSEMVIPVRTSACSRIELSNYTKKACEPIDTSSSSSLFDRQYSVKKLSEKFSVVNMREASRAGTWSLTKEKSSPWLTWLQLRRGVSFTAHSLESVEVNISFASNRNFINLAETVAIL